VLQANKKYHRIFIMCMGNCLVEAKPLHFVLRTNLKTMV
jgi:hypothetical protein